MAEIGRQGGERREKKGSQRGETERRNVRERQRYRRQRQGKEGKREIMNEVLLNQEELRKGLYEASA